MTFIETLLSLPRVHKRLISLVIDCVSLTCAYVFALFTYVGDINQVLSLSALSVFLLSLPGTLFVFIRLGLYRAVVRYLGQQALLVVVIGVFSSTGLLFFCAKWSDYSLPFSVLVTYTLVSLLTIGGIRILMRSIFQKQLRRQKEPVLIYGAGSAGRQLALALNNGDEYFPHAFIDDDTSLQNTTIVGLPVYALDSIPCVLRSDKVSKILLAIPSVPRSRRKKIIEELERFSLPIQTIPGFSDIINGKMKIDEIQNIKIEELLGRDAVEPRSDLMQANIHHKVVMVTGAGGSIGSELCRNIIHQQPRMLILYELNEYSLYEIEQELAALRTAVEIVPILGSVQIQERVESVMRSYHVNTVYHAAAYKHVPMVEYNIIEGVKNNVFGTWNTAEAAINSGVDTFVLISTDKAVRPTNIMGATKRVSELVLQALALRQTETRFSMVRFGNVLGSSGSVVPLFREQIRKGGPVTVTHPEIIRYFMTIPEASQLVIQAGAMGKGGDVFVLDMGEPVKISDLAKRMVNLMGLEVKSDDNPHGDIEIKYTGLRPGEKLFEELLIGEKVSGTEHPRILTAKEACMSWSQVSFLLRRLEDACEHFNISRIQQILQDAPAGYTPMGTIRDLVWNQKNNSSQVLQLSQKKKRVP